MFGRLTAQGGLLRNAVAGAVATAADFAVVRMLVEIGGFSVPAATFLGAGVGGLVNLLVNRVWAFGSDLHVAVQAGRYAAVSSASAVLNTVLVAMLIELAPGPYPLLWFVARGAVWLGWNYPMHRRYVFVRAVPEGPSQTGRTARR